MNKQNLLDDLVEKYETHKFVENDPIQFPHRFELKEDKEISGLISTSLAYGKRENIIAIVEKVHQIMENKPLEFCRWFDYEKDRQLFDGIKYRFNNGNDIALLLNSLSKAVKEYKSLENTFMDGFQVNDNSIKTSLKNFVDKLTSYAPIDKDLKGFNYLLPNPRRGSACKRLNLYLKWMVRKPPVDLGIWSDISTELLLIPLDTHVAKISRKLGLTERKSDDWVTAEEITNQLKKYCFSDPVKYDFALFGLGVSGDGL